MGARLATTFHSEPYAADITAAAWHELKAYLERRSKALSAQVRNYPDAVPRQEDELLELIEQRADAIQLLQLVTEADSTPYGARQRGSLIALGDIMRAQTLADDTLRAHLREALSVACSDA